MSDESPVTLLPNPARDELLATFAEAARWWQVMAGHSKEIATARRSMFAAYIEAGFTEAQALELCKSMTP